MRERQIEWIPSGNGGKPEEPKISHADAFQIADFGKFNNTCRGVGTESYSDSLQKVGECKSEISVTFKQSF